MRVAILTALHRRYDLTELFLSYYAKTWKHPLLCVIDDDDLRMWDTVRRYPEWTFVEHRNEPLADKWLAGMALCKEHRERFDAVMIMGSDDFVDAEYKAHIETALYLAHRELEDSFGEKQLPPIQIQPRYIHYMDAMTGRLMRVRHKRPGAGRVLTNALLDALDWQPWRAGDRNIDGSMDTRLAQVYGGNVPTMPVEESIGAILDVKTGESIWDYDYLRQKDFEDLDAGDFLPRHFPLLSTPLLTWPKKKCSQPIQETD